MVWRPRNAQSESKNTRPIMTDICHRMKQRPFSIPSKGRAPKVIESSVTSSASSHPVQSEATNSEVKSAALHITGLELDTLSDSEVLKEKGLQAEESGSSRASDVPAFKQKEETDVPPRLPTAHVPTSPPSHASGQGAACSELPGNLAAPAQDKGKGRAPPPYQGEDDELGINYRDNVRTNHAFRPFPVGSQEMTTLHHRVLQSSLQSTRSKRVLDHDDEECERQTKRFKEDVPGRNLTSLILGEADHSDEDSFAMDGVPGPSTENLSHVRGFR